MDVKTKLEIESATGDEHERIWESKIKPIFDQKIEDLFELFCATECSDVGKLQNIKMQHNALKAVEAHFKSIIDTGNMAKKQLEKENNDG